MLLLLLFIAACFLAYSNGANDNFKGVATLFGSGITNYKKAINWATITTFSGAVAAIFLAEEFTLPIAAIISAIIYIVLSLIQ